MNKRAKADSTIALFRKDVPENATIKTLSLSKNVVTLTLSTQDLTDIETYNKALVALTKEKKIVRNVVLTGITMGQSEPFEANYTITLL